MGIKDLNKIIKSRSPKSMTTHELSEIKGKIVAIDSNNIIWVIASGVNKALVSRIKDILTDTIDHSVFISMIIKRILDTEYQIRSRGGMTIWCFDGKSIEDKSEEVEKRKESREKIISKMEELKTQVKGDAESLEEDQKIKEKIRAHMNNSIPMRYDVMSGIGERLKTFGLNVAYAEYEAEAYAASLVVKGYADCVYTTDTDILAIGCNKMITSIQNNGFTMVNLDRILEDLSLTQGEFRDMCILLGCDFNKKLKGLGPEKIYNAILKYHRIERIPSANLSDLRYERCRELLSPVEVDYERGEETACCVESLLNYTDLQKVSVLTDFETFERQPFKRNIESFVRIINNLTK